MYVNRCIRHAAANNPRIFEFMREYSKRYADVFGGSDGVENYVTGKNMFDAMLNVYGWIVSRYQTDGEKIPVVTQGHLDFVVRNPEGYMSSDAAGAVLRIVKDTKAVPETILPLATMIRAFDYAKRKRA